VVPVPAGQVSPAARLDFEELQEIVSIIDENQRKTVLADEEAFRNFVKNEANNKSVLSAAQANKIDQNERNLAIAKRGAENILREIYLRQLIASKIPADFPTEQQISDYYEQNRDRFVLEDRLYVWQIFLPITEDMDQKKVELVKKQAESIISDLKKNKIDFSTAAQKYSEHQPSKYNGGYMGLVKVSELKPEIKAPLMALAQDTVGGPVTSADGLHVLKRGALVPSQAISLDEVRDQIKRLLNNQLRNQLRQAIFKQAAETYPVTLDDKKIEEWRLKLRTSLDDSKTAVNGE